MNTTTDEIRRTADGSAALLMVRSTQPAKLSLRKATDESIFCHHFRKIN